MTHSPTSSMLPIHSITASSPSRFCEWICVYQVYHIVTTSATYYNLEQWSFRFVSLTGASGKKSYVRPATKVLGKADVPLDRKTSRRIHVPQPKVDDKQFFTRVRTGVCYVRSIPLNRGRRIVRTVQGGMPNGPGGEARNPPCKAAAYGLPGARATC